MSKGYARKLTDHEQKRIERRWALKNEAIDVLGLIAAEFRTDPMSVQCFDERTVARAIAITDELKALGVVPGFG